MLGFLFVLFGAASWGITWEQAKWTQALAQVQKASLTADPGSHPRTYTWHLTLAYPLPTGQAVTAQVDEQGLLIDNWHAGQEAIILYDWARPEKVVLKDKDLPRGFLSAAALLGFGIYIFLQMAALLPYFIFSKKGHLEGGANSLPLKS
jgi:hypothetical protein